MLAPLPLPVKSPALNLRRFASRFRLDSDEALAYERREFRDAEALLTIPCRFSHLFPWAADRLAASTDTAGQTARPCVRIEQDGDDGATVSFPPELLPEVARIMRPKRRQGRHALTLGERQRLARAGRSYRFQTGKTHSRKPLEIVRAQNATQTPCGEF